MVNQRSPLTVREWSYLRLEDHGKAADVGHVPPSFLEAQKASIVSPTEKRVLQPHWARRIIGENGGYAEILQEAASRALKTPNEATLVEVYAVLNDVGRDPASADALRKVLTQENLDRILK